MDERAALRDALDRLHAALDDLAIRGLRAAGPRDIARLSALRDEFLHAGAGHISERLGATIDGIQADDRGAAACLLRAMTATRLFDRMLTLEVAAEMLSTAAQGHQPGGDTQQEDGTHASRAS